MKKTIAGFASTVSSHYRCSRLCSSIDDTRSATRVVSTTRAVSQTGVILRLERGAIRELNWLSSSAARGWGRGQRRAAVCAVYTPRCTRPFGIPSSRLKGCLYARGLTRSAIFNRFAKKIANCQRDTGKTKLTHKFWSPKGQSGWDKKHAAALLAARSLISN